MWVYIVRRVVAFFPTMFFVVTVVFFLTHLVPGDPAAVLVGHQLATEEKLAEIRKELELDKPILVQYTTWLSRIVKGNFGISIFLNRPVTEVVFETLPLTIDLSILSMALTLIVSIPMGILAAMKRNTLTDSGIMLFSVAGMSLPHFWLGFLFILLFAVTLNWLPTSGYQPLSMGFVLWIRHMILPALSLSLGLIALMTRMTRTSMLEILGKEYIMTARSKGLGRWQVIYKHALRNAMIQIVTVAGLSFAIILGGSIIIETVFALPGVGRLIITAAVRRDYPVIQGAVFYLTGITLFVNLVVDVSYSLINPKITYE